MSTTPQPSPTTPTSMAETIADINAKVAAVLSTPRPPAAREVGLEESDDGPGIDCEQRGAAVAIAGCTPRSDKS
jgi:hypothetical protein